MAISDGTKAQLVAGFYKLLPYISGVLVTKGVITQDQSTALINGAPEFISYAYIVAGVAGGVWTAIYSWWANRQAKKIADVAKMPEVTGVAVSSPELAAKVAKVAPQTVNTVVAP